MDRLKFKTGENVFDYRTVVELSNETERSFCGRCDVTVGDLIDGALVMAVRNEKVLNAWEES